MGRDIGPKDKQSRRLGEKLFLKGQRDLSPKSALVKRNYPPGLHGPKQISKKVSNYGKQMSAKQKIKKIYRLREKQFHRYFIMAGKQKGRASDNLLKILESRLDNIVYRLGLADSRDQARQLVTHGHITLNKKKNNIPSSPVRINDLIAVREQSRKNNFFSKMLQENARKDIPAWLFFEQKDWTGKILEEPDIKSLNLDNEAMLTVEFYSR